MLVSSRVLCVALLAQQLIAEADIRRDLELEAQNNGGSNITLQLPGHVNESLSGSAASPSSTPLTARPPDPYQLRVPDTQVSLIFSKYGPSISHTTFLEIAYAAQYDILQGIAIEGGTAPVPEVRYQWDQGRTAIKISRPMARADLTWLDMADTVEGIRLFFEQCRAWFELQFEILDDDEGPVGTGWVDIS